MPAANALVAIDHDDQVAALKTMITRWAEGGPSRVIIVGVAPALSGAMTNPKVVSLAKDAEKIMLGDLRDRMDQVGADIDAPAEFHLLAGRTADEIIKAAVLHKADFVIKAADRALGVRSPVFGAVEKKLIRKCPAPVWVVRNEQDCAPRRIAVAVDNTDAAANRAEAELLAVSLIRRSVDLAHRFGVEEVTIIHAWSAVGVESLKSARSGLSPQAVRDYVREWETISSRWLNGFAATVRERFSDCEITITPKLVMGDPRKAISVAAKELGADLLVMGSANRSGVPGLFIGNTAEGIIDLVECSVFVVKPEGFSAVFAANP